jgi:hypothetical protein
MQLGSHNRLTGFGSKYLIMRYKVLKIDNYEICKVIFVLDEQMIKTAFKAKVLLPISIILRQKKKN